MPMTPAERQQSKRQRDRARNRALGVKTITLEMAATERQAITDGADRAGYEDQTEYLLSLVYADRDRSPTQQERKRDK